MEAPAIIQLMHLGPVHTFSKQKFPVNNNQARETTMKQGDVTVTSKYLGKKTASFRNGVAARLSVFFFVINRYL